uniref:Outer membrane protein beta-barrel domain-containing protein n=1 Tax=Eiseniibacteriota bacterium TaxID=2212470 RepID=A0A832I3G1_UNCEI
MNRRQGTAAAALVLALAGAAPSGAATITLPRPGQVGFGAQGQFGALMKRGDFGEDFGAGAGISFRARYRMRFERGLGLSFERQGFEARSGVKPDTSGGGRVFPETLTLQTATFDVYQMFGTRTRTPRYLSAGLGLAQATQKLDDGTTRVSGRGAGDGFLVSAGAGVEYFFWQSWAVDLSTRYHAIFHRDRTNHDVQVSAGLIFYAAY